MKTYSLKLEALTDVQLRAQNKDVDLQRIHELIEGLKDTLREYLNGFPAKTYNKFKATIESNGFGDKLTELRVI